METLKHRAAEYRSTVISLIFPAVICACGLAVIGFCIFTAKTREIRAAEAMGVQRAAIVQEYSGYTAK